MNANRNTLKAEVERAMVQLARLDGTMELGIFADPDYYDRMSADLLEIHAHGDLHAIRLELLNQHERVLFCLRMEFGTGQVHASPAPSETPMIERNQVKSHRIVVEHNEQDPVGYRGGLGTQWREAEESPRVKGSIFPYPTGTFFVSNGARRELVVVRSGAQYAFADTATKEPKLTGIFVHPRYTTAPWPPKAGSRLNAVLVATPDGIQARDIRAAA